jgi:acyl-CoA thioester hydrolase
VSWRKKNYFKREDNSPAPIVARVKHHVAFSEVDAMAVAWHGRYAQYFELAYSELTRKCGLGYEDFYKAKLRAPIVQFHTDYFQSLYLEEEITIEARLIWDEGARINMEYSIFKANGTLAATGYTVQMFIDDAGALILTMPALLESCRARWQRGEIA